MLENGEMDRFEYLVWLPGNLLLFLCPLVLENSPTFGLGSHAGTSTARVLFVCRSCCPSVSPSRMVIVRSPTNACMLLKTKRVLEFKIQPDHVEQKPDCAFLGLPFSILLTGLPWPHRTIHKYNRARCTHSRACDL